MAGMLKLPFCFDQEKLADLSHEPAELVAELNPINRYYGIGSVFRGYAGLLAKEPLPFSIEHYIPFDNETPHSYDLLPGLPAFLAANQQRAAVYKSHTTAEVFSAGFAIHYAAETLKQAGWREPDQRAGTVAFPHKSTRLIDRDFNDAAFADWLLSLPAECHPVSICMYWKDCQRGKHRTYQDRGIPVYTCGHLHDPEFLIRFIDLCSHFKFSCGNVLGSCCPLSIACGCYFFWQDFGGFTESVAGVMSHRPGGFETTTSYGRRFRDATAFPPTAERAAAQRRLTEDITGARHLLSRDEIRDIYWSSRSSLLASQRSVKLTGLADWPRLNAWLPIGIEPDGWARSEAGFTIAGKSPGSSVEIYLLLPDWGVGEQRLTVRIGETDETAFLTAPGYYRLTAPLRGEPETRITLKSTCEQALSEQDPRRAALRILGWELAGGANKAASLSAISPQDLAAFEQRDDGSDRKAA